MSNVPVLNLQPVDVNGKPYPGAKLYSYRTGTTTPKATFTDEACTPGNENANPVVADANGRFGDIHCLDDEPYAFVLKTSSGVTIKTWDGVRSLALSNSTYATRIKQIASNPIDFGAVGDGVADESEAVQAAIDAATGVVDLLGKTYRCDSAIDLKSGITLRNGALDFSSCADDEYLKLVGSMAAPKLLATDAAAGAQELDLANVTGLVVGDWLYLTDSGTYRGGATAHGEMVQVQAIAGTTVTLAEQLLDSYTTELGATASKLVAKVNVTLRDLRLVASINASGAGRVVYLEDVDNVFLQNVRVSSPKASGFEVRGSVNVSAVGCTVNGAEVTGVGFDVAAHSRNVSLVQCRAFALDAGFRVGAPDASGGVCRLVGLRDIGAYGCTTGVSTAVTADLTTIDGEVVTPSGGGILDDNGYRTRCLGLADVISGNYAGATSQGGGTGAGAEATGGDTGGAGFAGLGGAGSGPGFAGVGGAPNGNGGTYQGTGTGAGVSATGGTTSGAGAKNTGGAPNGRGATNQGTGTGAGTHSTGGANNGDGVVGVGGGTTGRGGDFSGTADGARGQGAVGLRGVSTAVADGTGVVGSSAATGDSAGVAGSGTNGAKGMSGTSDTGPGQYGSSTSGPGAYGKSTSGPGVKAESTNGPALHVVARSSAPSTPAEGWVYANSTDHKLYYYDGSSWLELVPVSVFSSGMQGVSVDGVGVHGKTTGAGAGVKAESTGTGSPLLVWPRSSAPSEPGEGGLYYNSTDHKLYLYNGSTWVDLTA